METPDKTEIHTTQFLAQEETRQMVVAAGTAQEASRVVIPDHRPVAEEEEQEEPTLDQILKHILLVVAVVAHMQKELFI